MAHVRNNIIEAYSPAPPISIDRPAIISLVDKAAGGSFEAFGELYHQYVGRIYRYVLYQVKDRMRAEDITANVFVKALDSIRSCKGRGETFSPWLYRIAYNQVIDSFRRAKRDAHMGLDGMVEEVADPTQQPDKDLEWQEIQEAISRLPDKQRQVIMLKFIEGLDNREVGQVMGKSQVAIRLLQLRALTSLRERLGAFRGL